MAIKLILLFSLSMISLCTFAQGIPGGAPCWPPPCVPIDGGITIFGLIAAFFGYRSLSKNK